MVHVQLPNGTVQWPEAKFVTEVTAKRLPPMTQVSVDDGATWISALEALKKIGPRDQALGVFVPVNVEPLAMTAGYVAIFTLFFCGGPASGVSAAMAWETGPKLAVRLGAVAVGLLFGPLPPGLLGYLALRRLEANPSMKGKGRAIFALVVAALLLVGPLIGLAGVVVR